MTYQENIERLRAAGRYNLQLQKQNIRDRKIFIDEKEKEIIDNIDKATDLLVGKEFGSDRIVTGEGGTIPFLYGERIKKKQKEGIEAEKLDRARKVEELRLKLQETSDIDTAHLKAKYKMLINGYLYEDADRYAQLSPHAQVAYARRKLGLWKDSIDLRLNGELAENHQKYSIKDWPKELSSKDIHNDPNIPPIIKEQFVNKILEELIKKNGIDGFSDELLELEGINDFVNPQTGQIEFGAHSKAKNKVMNKYRTIYNVTNSNRKAVQYMEDFKLDLDLGKLIYGLSGLVDKDGETPLGPAGAWDTIVELTANELHLGGLTKAQVIKAFKNTPSATVPGETLWESHKHKYNLILQKAALMNQNRARADKILAETKGDVLKEEIILDFEEGGKNYKFLFEEAKIQNMSFEERNKFLNQALGNLQTQYTNETGETSDLNAEGFSPFLADIKSRLLYLDQNELVGKALVKLDNGAPLLPQDIKGIGPKGMQELMRHPKWAENQGFIKLRGLTHRWIKPDGTPGRDLTIHDLVKKALKDYQLADEDKDLIAYLEEDFKNKFQFHFAEAFKDKSKRVNANDAYNYAMDMVKYELGLAKKDGNLLDTKKVIKNLTKPQGPEFKFNSFQNKKAEELSRILNEKASNLPKGELIGTRYWIPSLGPNSPEFQQLLAYVETGKGGIPEIYNHIAGLMPDYNLEDIVNWQLAQIGKALPKKSLSNQAIKFNEALNGFNRLIGFKTVSTDLHQAKINALDGVRLSGISTAEWAGQLPENQNLKFDEDGLPIRPEGDEGDEGDVEISKDQQLINEEKRLSNIYNEKGYHEIDPGPKPNKEDFLIQPGDVIQSVNYGYYTGPTSMDSVKYNMEAYQAAVRDWQEKKNLYRPLTKQQTGGSRKKYTYTVYFNPETDSYESRDLESRLFPEERIDGRAKLSKQRQERSRMLRLERAESMPASKVVDIHRQDGKYFQGPITVYKHVDQDGNVQYKITPSGPNSNLQSFWNIPGSPVLTPALQDYAMELYTANLQTA